MCGRYTIARTPEDLVDYFEADFEESARSLPLPIYNASPGQALPVITSDASGRIRTMHWGMTRDRTGHGVRFLINARSETVSSRPAFRESFRLRRCLVPADGFYEWKADTDGKQPFRIVLTNGDPFAFAGIWEQGPSGEARFVILTTEADRAIRTIHDRMPVILSRGSHAAWLDLDRGAAGFGGWFRSDVRARLRAYPVSREVNSSRHDGPSLIEPVVLDERGLFD